MSFLEATTDYIPKGKHFTRTVDPWTRFEAIVLAGYRDEDDDDDLHTDEYVSFHYLH
jgi:hypothetical protein